VANALYDKGRQGFLNKLIDWGTGTATDDIKVILIDTADYTVSLSADEFATTTTVPAAARVATSGNLAGKTVTNGVADANDITLTAVSGDQSEALVIYQDTGTAATSRLIAYIDVATGLPVQPNGGDINIVFDNGANKIFKL
jgi:hypothetical protein